MKTLLLFLITLLSTNSFSQWAKSIGGPNYDNSFSIAVDKNDNVYLTGYYNGTADFDPSSGTTNLTSTGKDEIFFAKYDASGTLQWAKSVGGTDSDVAYSMAVDESGNVYLTGYFKGTADFDPSSGTVNLTSAGSHDIFLAKYNTNGQLKWAKSISGTGSNVGKSIVADVNGNVYLTGYFEGTADFDPSDGTSNLTSAGSVDIFLAKYDSSGVFQWAKSAGGTDYDQGYSLAIDDNSQNVYLTGCFTGTAEFNPTGPAINLTSAGSDDIFLAKYDSNGAIKWAKSAGGTSSDEGHSIAVDKIGNVYLTGFFNITADFDPSDGTSKITSAGLEDIFFAKYNANGILQWAKSAGGNYYDEGLSITVDGDGNVYLTGYFGDIADFDPSEGTTNLTCAGIVDIFYARYDSSGTFQWAKSAGGTGIDQGHSIVVDRSRNIYLTGCFNNMADFDPSDGTINLISAGDNEIFFAKYNASDGLLPVELSSPNVPVEFSLSQNYPNPFNPSTKIVFTLKYPGYVTLEVFDVLGRKVKKLLGGYLNSGRHEVIFNAEELTSGVYFYQLKNNKNIIIKKMILLR